MSEPSQAHRYDGCTEARPKSRVGPKCAARQRPLRRCIARHVNLLLPYGTECELCDHTPSLGSRACVDDRCRDAVSADLPVASLGPLWTSRMSGTTVAPLSIQQAAKFFNSLAAEMEDRGFFQEWCGFVCVDAGPVAGRLGPDPVERIELETGRADLWRPVDIAAPSECP